MHNHVGEVFGGHNDILEDIRGTLISLRYFLRDMGQFLGDIVPCPSLISRLDFEHKS